MIAEGKAARAAEKAKGDTLEKVIKQYLKDREGDWKPRYRLEVQRQLNKDWKPLHKTPIKGITRKQVVDTMDKIAESQGKVPADRAKAALSGLFTWAIDRSLADATPIMKIKLRADSIARDRTLKPQELAEVWHAAGVVGGNYERIVKLLLLTGQRRDEIGGLQWVDVGHLRGEPRATQRSTGFCPC